ncbi:MAG: amidohydrolase [Candidatus Omnitrophota bacterium]
MNKLLWISAILCLFVPGLSENIPHKTADLVLIHGKIITMDASKPTAEALAVAGDTIIAVGKTSEIKPYISTSTQIIDLKGKLAIPGLIESHGHFTSFGNSRLKLDLKKAKNWDDIVEMVAAAVKHAKPGEWILGRGWHQEKWDRLPNPQIGGLPIHTAISHLSPQNPVLLTHASGHSIFANAKAMELAGITSKTPNPDGGEILKDQDGNPTGIFLETAGNPIEEALEKYLSARTPDQVQKTNIKIIEMAIRGCLENGITSFHDAGATFETIDLYKQLAQEKKLDIRLNVMIGEPNAKLRQSIARYKLIDLYDHHLTVRSIKRLIDGALGSHGAWLLQPYDSLPTSTGLNTESIETMKESAQIAIANGFQLCTHAIGDRANRETLNIYEEALKSNPTGDLRWRIEHAQHLDPADIPRFSKLHVIAAMQGIHCTSDAPWVIKRLGKERARQGAYVWRKLLDTGAVISNGTDVPVEDINPIACFYASVTRKLKDGTIFYGDQRMSREEALRAYTLNGAYASFEEKIKGSLTIGKLADITVLSRDMLTVPEDEIPQTKVVYTIIGGKILYASN